MNDSVKYKINVERHINTSNSFGIFIVNKHNANNELYLEDSYSEIQYESYESFFQPSGTSCEGNGAPLTTTNSLLSQDDSLSYNITDISSALLIT